MLNHNNDFAILSHVLPPAASGQAVVLYRLLEKFPAGSYCLMSSGLVSGNATQTLSAEFFRLRSTVRGWERIASVTGSGAERITAWQVGRRAQEIERILRKNNIRLLIACSGDFLDIPAGARAASQVGIPFVPYFFDDYLFQWTGWRREVARSLEKKAMVGAAGVIVPNEFLAEEYRRRYGLTCQIVRNPILMPHDEGGLLPVRACGRGKRIVYTGSVYHAHYDAFRRLSEMLAREGLAELHIYSAQTEEALAQHGICGSHVKIMGHVNQQESLRVQREADILFLPLAFSSSIPEVLRTSAPGKMGEYLASGAPILVHAPKDSFLSWFFREHRCGRVVDSLDVSALAEAVRDLLAGGDEVDKMTEQACAIAKAEFSSHHQSEVFYRYLSTIGRRNP